MSASSPPKPPVTRAPAMTGSSPAYRALIAKVDKISRYRTNVLLCGESGSGKEVVARAIHARGPRRDHRYEPQNCATLSAELLASELFGHEQGAFTGAHARKIGLFELADGGTLLLDEIAEMDLGLQAKLLRVLEMRRFRRVGGTQLYDLDLSIIAATNGSLPRLVSEGRFRADLYYRLKVVTITVPPLRDRREDIPLLVEQFISHFNERHDTHLTGVSPSLMKRLMAYAWPGNVRELRNAIESMGVLSEGAVLGEREAEEAAFEEGTLEARAPGSVEIPAHATLAEAERTIIAERMRQFTARSDVARSLGIGLRTLYSKLHERRG